MIQLAGALGTSQPSRSPPRSSCSAQLEKQIRELAGPEPSCRAIAKRLCHRGKRKISYGLGFGTETGTARRLPAAKEPRQLRGCSDAWSPGIPRSGLARIARACSVDGLQLLGEPGRAKSPCCCRCPQDSYVVRARTVRDPKGWDAPFGSEGARYLHVISSSHPWILPAMGRDRAATSSSEAGVGVIPSCAKTRPF